MTFSAKEMIKQRKSVRTFDGKTLSDEDKKNLESYVHSLTNPFGVKVDFRLLDAKEHQLSSPVIVGEHTYLAAKSAGNKQPWRAVIDENRVHFYELKSLKDNALGDVQKVDVGIALCHFDLVMAESGVSGKFIFEDPQIKAPENIYYIATYERIG